MTFHPECGQGSTTADADDNKTNGKDGVLFALITEPLESLHLPPKLITSVK